MSQSQLTKKEVLKLEAEQKKKYRGSFILIRKDEKDPLSGLIKWNPGRRYGQMTRKERREFERRGDKPKTNNRKGGRQRDQAVQARAASYYRRLYKLGIAP